MSYYNIKKFNIDEIRGSTLLYTWNLYLYPYNRNAPNAYLASLAKLSSLKKDKKKSKNSIQK